MSVATRKHTLKGARGKQSNAAVRPKRRAHAAQKWSARVSRHSDALDLKTGVFKLRSARQIAQSLKKSAEASRRRTASPFQSAMSMLNFEINRAGKTLAPARRHVLDRAKGELRKAFGRPPGKPGQVPQTRGGMS
jgi:hypothetical protein